MEKILVGKLVGMSDPGQWSQVHVFVPEGGRKEVLGSLIVAVAVRQKESIDLAAFGQEIIQRVHEEYYGLEVGNLVGLKLVLERVKGEFSQVELEDGGERGSGGENTAGSKSSRGSTSSRKGDH